MLDHRLIKVLYENRYSYAEIARKFKVSRQRIHQIIKGYKNTGKNARKNKYQLLPTICAICGKERKVLHHIDLNNKNDQIDNLLPLCLHCHKKIHIGTRSRVHWSKNYDYCQRCLRNTVPHGAKGYCQSCYSNCISKNIQKSLRKIGTI